MSDMKKEISYVGARLRESSTYAGLIVIVSVGLPLLAKYVPSLGMANAQDVVNAISLVGTGIGALIAIVLPEGS
jgi:xanthine/uracil permease